MAAVLKKRALAEYSQTIQEPAYENKVKRLRLVKKCTPGNTTLALISCLESSKTSSDALRTLLRISDVFELDPSDIPEAVRKLSDHFKIEAESAVRVKILSMLADLGMENNADVITIIDETLLLIKNDKSHKVISQGMNTVLKLGKLIPDNVTVHSKLVNTARNYLKDVNHAVKCKCLEIIGVFTNVSTDDELNEILKLVGSYFTNSDARVRAQSFSTMITLHNRGLKLNPNVYSSVYEAIKDDYEIVRQVVLKLLWVLGNAYPEHIIVIADSEQEIRLIDDAFGKICDAVNDLSIHVRTLASKLLGSMTLVSAKFLNQTLDKKLMSNMRRKRTAHELAWENVTSGEWASGKKWADDKPREVIDADSINLMSSGACGAFVHGLEDEYLEVRSATVESICQLSLNNPEFSNLSLDYLVDMFNDEIEDVRLKAIDSLRLISEHIVLRDDQLETILAALEDFSQEVREGLHRMLASCHMSTTAGLKMCIDKLLDNLKKYPQDKKSTYKCLQRIGAQHPELVLPLVPLLLGLHPYFDMTEIDIDNPLYVCQLILILNAAKYSVSIVPLLEQSHLRHYLYLRDTMPNLVAELDLPDSSSNVTVRQDCVPESLQFLKTIIDSLDVAENNNNLQITMLQTAKEQLNRLSGIDTSVSGVARFTGLYIGAHLLMSKLLQQGSWSNPASLATVQQAQHLQNQIKLLLQQCLQLQHMFVGLAAPQVCHMKMFKLRALAMNLVYIVKDSKASALAPCHHFLSAVEDMQRELAATGEEPDTFTASVFRELATLEEPKPGTVARVLIPILEESRLSKIPQPNPSIKMTTAEILEPTGRTDSSLKFTAGLIMAIPFEAEFRNLADPSRLRLKIKYPDQKTQIVLPRPGHLKPLLFENPETNVEENGHSLRLLTTVLISHQVWSEACNIEISLALAVPEADIEKRKPSAESSPYLLDLCKPVKISVAPKPIKPLGIGK